MDEFRANTAVDEDLDMDFLIDDDELDLDADSAPAAPRGRSRFARRGGTAYRPVRMRRTPNWGRIAAAAFVGIVGLLVVIAIINAWRDHARTSAYEQYFASVTELVNQSNTQGKELDALLTQNSGVDRTQVVAQLEKLESRANSVVTDVRKLAAPERLADAHESLVTTFNYRRTGFEQLRKGMTGALAVRDQTAPSESLSAAMARLLASDVIYQDSYASAARSVLKADEVTGVTVPESSVVTQTEAVSPKGMKLILERLRSNRVTTTKGGKVKKVNDGKIHGGQLDAVSVSPSGQVLSSGGVTEISGSDKLAFEVTFTNQGEVQETRIPVVITLSNDANPSVELTGEIESVDPGQTGSVTIPVDEVPAFGTTFDMKVMVGPVPGEKTTDNNGASYQVTFRL